MRCGGRVGKFCGLKRKMKKSSKRDKKVKNLIENLNPNK